MRMTGVIRLLVLLATLLGSWFIVQTYFERSGRAISLRSWLGATSEPMSTPPQPRHKCANKRDCPADHFAFRIISGAANVVGPSICFEDRILMSTVKNNIGRGLNIALVNGKSGQLLKVGSFDMYSGDVTQLETFLQEIKDGTIMLVATYDDAATKMNNKVRALFFSAGQQICEPAGLLRQLGLLRGKGAEGQEPL